MKRARIIYNPTSGKEQFKRNLPEVLQRLEEAGYETSCHATVGRGDATNAAIEAAKRNFDMVIASGGDGTINEVVTGLSQVENPPKLGIIPTGTTNDFARAMGISRNILEAVDVILEENPVPIDIGKVNDKFFINIAAAGIFTEVSYEAHSKLKTAFGELAYFLKGIEKLPSVHPVHVDIEYDGKEFSGEIMMFFISNTNSVGGFEKIAPIASVNDGLFDLILIKKGNIAELINVATKIVSGTHVNHPLVSYEQASRVKIKASEEMSINLDGEYGGITPAEFINLHNHLEVFLPVGRVNE